MERLVPTNGVRLWVHASGDAARTPVVWLHGGFGAYDYLGPVAAVVEDLARNIRYDQRGCGRSERLGPYDDATWVADLEALRVALGIERWVVAGHSAGCSLAVAYATHHPDRVAGAICISPYSALVEHADRCRSDYHANYRQRLGPERCTELDRLRAAMAGADAATRDTLAAAAQRIKDATDVHDPAGPLPRLDAFPANREVNAAIRLRVTREQASLLRAPALVVHGLSDPRPAWAARELADAIHAEWVAISACGHFPWVESPAVLREALRGFVAGLE